MTHEDAQNAPRQQGKLLFWRGYTCSEIARQLGVAPSTVFTWRDADRWLTSSVAEKVSAHLEMRLNQLIMKDEKSERDYHEMERLALVLERTARIERYENGGNEADLNPNIRKRNAGKKKQERKALFAPEEIDTLRRTMMKALYPHQQQWWTQGQKYFLRQYLKSRQIGATWYFALEALMTALQTEKNQIFLSASRSQAEVFRSNIVSFVEKTLDKTLKGNPIKLGNGAHLYFLSTNANTAQSYSGDLYVDEFFWIPNFSRLQQVATGMATHDDRRITYFSTPSSTSHEAYTLWTGEHFNEGRPRKEHVTFDVSPAALKAGKLCPDGYFRQTITIEDAIAAGFDLVSIEKLKIKYAPAAYNNLMMCQFVNDSNSLFKLNQLQRCMVDSWSDWPDFAPFTARPLGDAPVWIGYDPSRSRDDASLVVVAPPTKQGENFRILEKQSFNGLDFDAQAQRIREMTNRYHVDYIGIDATGIGLAVFELVAKFFPRVTKILYSVEEKNAMVLKAAQLVHNGRLQYERTWTDLTNAFMTIYQASTGSGRAVTYKAARTKLSGHSDLAWATMHALIHDPLGAIDDIGCGLKTTVEIF